MVRIEGAGIAGRVLRRELSLAGIASELKDRAGFPRQKVCGGVLQWESWEYLKANFPLRCSFRRIERMSHHWRGKKAGQMELDPPVVYVSRFELDAGLESAPSPAAVSYDIRVDASGARHEGEWIGFQSTEKAPLSELEMHYGRGICLGISPTPENNSHVAFIVKRDRFREPQDLRRYIKEELGVTLFAELKGTGRIRYGYADHSLAVGDAKMTTFPFLGLGMKHAIGSARLLASCLADGDPSSYAKLHQKKFSRQRRSNVWAGRLYDSPLQFLLKPFITNSLLFGRLYRWLHE